MDMVVRSDVPALTTRLVTRTAACADVQLGGRERTAISVRDVHFNLLKGRAVRCYTLPSRSNLHF